MDKHYLGILQQDDPLYDYLKYDIQPQLSDFCDDPFYLVYRFNASNAVYLYEERNTGVKIIGKYFYSEREENPEAAYRRLEREYDALATMRALGFDCPPFYVAKPLGKNYDLGDLLTVEHCEGEMLSHVILRALNDGDESVLYDRLSTLAAFFAELHNRSADMDSAVDFDETCNYAAHVVDQCSTLLSEEEQAEFYFYTEQWHDRPEMWEDCQVLVHGDATPENFMFAADGTLQTFDMERSIYTDRIFDIGRMAGEIKHFFLMQTDDDMAAEPFLDHFLRQYASHFPDAEAAFNAVTRRVPFYMGVTLLRIARNFWINLDYRRRLVDLARNCFQGEEE